MNQKTQPWEEPLEESYWQALLEEECRDAPPEPNDRETWEAFDLPKEAQDRGTENPHPSTGSEGVWAQQQARWAEIRDSFENGVVLESEVVGHNRGGLLVDCDGLQGFVPASQLVGFAPTSEEDRYSRLQEFLGRRLGLKIIELDGERNRLILSQRAAESGEGSPRAILGQLSPGTVCEGWVTNLCSFGAFVDLGGIEGLIHISELSWGRVRSPDEVLSAGDKVEVYVLNVDHERGRVGLSLKRLQPDPWGSVEQNYQVGQTVTGMVTNVVDFGAFVRVEEGVEGLIHVSELAEGRFLHPRNVVQEGESVTVRIINIDSDNHRLGLSLRRQ